MNHVKKKGWCACQDLQLAKVFRNSINILKPFIKNSLGSCKLPRQIQLFGIVRKVKKEIFQPCYIHIITPSSLKISNRKMWVIERENNPFLVTTHCGRC